MLNMSDVLHIVSHVYQQRDFVLFIGQLAFVFSVYGLVQI